MTGATDGDVDRALAAMGATNIKYHSFGVMTVRPPGTDPVNPGTTSPGFQQHPGLPPTGEGTTERYRAHAASTVFPLLGLALPEAFQIDVEPEWPVGPPVSDPGLFLNPDLGGHVTGPHVGYPPTSYPGQPYNGPANTGQPYAGHPAYAGQAYPGQPYPGQPYPGQPYPGQPYQVTSSAGSSGYPPQAYPPQPYPSAPQPESPAAYPSFSTPPWLDASTPAVPPPSAQQARPAWLDLPLAPPTRPEPPAQMRPVQAASPSMAYPPAASEPQQAGNWHAPPAVFAPGNQSFSPFAQNPAVQPATHERGFGSGPSWLDEAPAEPRTTIADWSAREASVTPALQPTPDFATSSVHEASVRPHETPRERLHEQWRQLPDPANFEPNRYDPLPFEPPRFDQAGARPNTAPPHSDQRAPEPTYAAAAPPDLHHPPIVQVEPGPPEPYLVEPQVEQARLEPATWDTGHIEPNRVEDGHLAQANMEPTWHEPPMFQSDPLPPSYNATEVQASSQADGQPGGHLVSHPAEARNFADPGDSKSSLDAPVKEERTITPAGPTTPSGRRPLADMFRTLGGGKP